MTTGPTGGSTTARSLLAQAAAVGALVLAVLACYLPTPGDYWIHYDNPGMIEHEPRTLALTLEGPARRAALIELATTPHHDLYQPLASLSWAIDHKLFGWDRTGFHAHSLALHIAVVVALFFLALRLCDSVLAAFLAALLCGIHPVMVQSVCWTISRTSSLAAIWILIGSHLHLSYARRPEKHYLLAFSTLAFALSMTAKALPSIVFIPVLLDVWLGRSLRPKVLIAWLPLALVAGLLTLVNLQTSNSFASEASIVRPWLEVLQKTPESFGLTVANAIWPRDLALHYSFEGGGALIGWRWLAVAGTAVFTVTAGLALWRRGERGLLVAGVGFLALYAPQVPAVRYRDILTADRYVYIPLLFLALGVASLLARAFSDRTQHSSLISSLIRPGALALATVAALGLAVQTRADSRMWADEQALWQRVVSQTPAPLPFLALCKLHAREGRLADAVEACEQAHNLATQDRYASRDATYAFNLVMRARQAGEEWKASAQPDAARNAARYFDLASSHATRASERWPDRVDLRYELGRAQLSSGEVRRAIETFEALLAIDPDDEPSITYLAVALYQAGELDRSLAMLKADLSAGMVEPTRYITIGQIYSEKGEHHFAAGANLLWVHAVPDTEAAHSAFRASVRAARKAGQGDLVEGLRESYLGEFGELIE